jgi:tryptophan synthase alpha chain
VSAAAASRLAARFQALRREARAGLAVYVLAGDPDPETSAAILQGLPQAGVDLIEIGVPSARPAKDGAFIRAAHKRARAGGATAETAFALVRRFREKDSETPLVLMGYRETVDRPADRPAGRPGGRSGSGDFLARLAEAGGDAVLVADADADWLEARDATARAAKVELIRLVTPADDPALVRRLLRGAGGFVYYATVKGPTGGGTASRQDLREALAALRGVTTLPIAAGFGIREPAQAAAAAGLADAVVVGTALVERVTTRLAGGSGGRATVAASVLEAAAALAEAVRNAGKGAGEEKGWKA